MALVEARDHPVPIGLVGIFFKDEGENADTGQPVGPVSYITRDRKGRPVFSPVTEVDFGAGWTTDWKTTDEARRLAKSLGVKYAESVLEL